MVCIKNCRAYGGSGVCISDTYCECEANYNPTNAWEDASCTPKWLDQPVHIASLIVSVVGLSMCAIFILPRLPISRNLSRIKPYVEAETGATSPKSQPSPSSKASSKQGLEEGKLLEEVELEEGKLLEDVETPPPTTNVDSSGDAEPDTPTMDRGPRSNTKSGRAKGRESVTTGSRQLAGDRRLTAVRGSPAPTDLASPRSPRGARISQMNIKAQTSPKRLTAFMVGSTLFSLINAVRSICSLSGVPFSDTYFMFPLGGVCISSVICLCDLWLKAIPTMVLRQELRRDTKRWNAVRVLLGLRGYVAEYCVHVCGVLACIFVISAIICIAQESKVLGNAFLMVGVLIIAFLIWTILGLASYVTHRVFSSLLRGIDLSNPGAQADKQLFTRMIRKSKLAGVISAVAFIYMIELYILDFTSPTREYIYHCPELYLCFNIVAQLVAATLTYSFGGSHTDRGGGKIMVQPSVPLANR